MSDSYKDWCENQANWCEKIETAEGNIGPPEEAPQSARYNAGKAQLHFLMMFPTAMESLCRVKEFGACKYDYGNFLKGNKPWQEPIDSCMRHLFAYQRWAIYQDTGVILVGYGLPEVPSYFDPETGCPHLAHAMWNLAFLQDMCHKGETHHPKVFDKMCAFWKSAKGLTWDTIMPKLQALQSQTDKELAS